jgi:hypothetical protein
LAVEREAQVLLEGERDSHFERLWVVVGPDHVAAFYSNRTAMDGGRVGVLHSSDAASGWKDWVISREKPSIRALSPVAVFDPTTRVYNVVFHEMARIQFLGAPEIWDTSLAFSQLKLEVPSDTEVEGKLL